MYWQGSPDFVSAQRNIDFKALDVTPSVRASIGLGPKSRVLLINTEGATAPLVYQEHIDQSVDQVIERQQHWLKAISLTSASGS